MLPLYNRIPDSTAPVPVTSGISRKNRQSKAIKKKFIGKTGW